MDYVLSVAFGAVIFFLLVFISSLAWHFGLLVIRKFEDTLSNPL